MKTPVALRPSAWEPRQRLIAAVVAAVVVVAGALWWVLGADGRRESAACELYQEQQGALRELLVQVSDAADAAAAADDPTLILFFDNPASTLNTMRRWQSTQPRVLEERDGADDAAAATFTDLTESVAELQRVIEANVATDAVAYTPEVADRLDAADAVCA